MGIPFACYAPLLSCVDKTHEALPSGFVIRCLDLWQTLSSSEHDLIRVVVELVHELRYADDDDEASVHPSAPSPPTIELP